MTNWKKAKLYTFLTERGVRVKAARVPELGLQRVDKIDFTGRIHLSERPTNTDMILVKSGDLLISGINAAKGAVAVYKGEADVLASIHYSSYRLEQSLIDVDYLRSFLRSTAFEKILRASTNGGIKTELKAKHLLPLEIELPPLAEQFAIARAVESHQKEIAEVDAELTHQITLLTRLRQAILREAVQGRLLPQDPTDEPAPALLARIRAEKQRLIKEKKLRAEKPLPPLSDADIPYEVPSGWVWERLGNLAETCLGKMLDGQKNKGQLLPYLRNVNVRWFDFNLIDVFKMPFEAKETSRFGLEAGDVLVCEGGEPGRAAIWDSRVKDMRFQKAIHRVRCSTALLNSYFLYHLFLDAQTGNLKKHFTGATIQHFTGKNLALYPIPLPPLAEQRRIVAKVAELLAHCTELEVELDQARAAANALHASALREAFTDPTEALVKAGL
jgi:type I restriction enzyme S subunit